MKSLLITSALSLATVLHASPALSISESKPNIVIIYGDDVGYGDVGVYGSEKIPTPNIDQLAAQGIQFMDGHSTAATCTPSRYSMLTGMYGFREGVDILSPEAPLCLPTDTLTLPKMLRKAGYATAVIGKWHMGLGEACARGLECGGQARPTRSRLRLLLSTPCHKRPCALRLPGRTSRR